MNHSTAVRVRTWSPFKIDALGIVTLLGAEAVKQALGRLVHSPWEFCPLLAGHIFADNSIVAPMPGFVLQNITDCTTSTDLSTWFTRWLLCQEMPYNLTRLEISEVKEDAMRSHRVYKNWTFALHIVFAIVINVSMIVIPATFQDWYGFVSASGLVVTVLVRVIILQGLRKSVDQYMKTAVKGNGLSKHVKLFIKLPNGNCLTVKTTRGITTQVLLTEARMSSQHAHKILRSVCWAGFCVHAVTLGMASLVTQLLIVTCVLLCSLLMVGRYLSEEHVIGNYLHILRTDAKGIQSRARTLLELDLNKAELQNAEHLLLSAPRTNKVWWDTFTVYREAAANSELTPKQHLDVLESWPTRIKAAHDQYQSRQGILIATTEGVDASDVAREGTG